MIRLLSWMVLLLALGALIAWVADNPGQMVIHWQNYVIESSFAVLVFGGLALILAFGALLSLWGWMRRDMPFFGSNRHYKTQARGLEALNRAVVALATGDVKEAARLVDRADRLLPPQPMTHVIAAQASLMAGKPKEAEKHYQALLKHPDAEFIGVRGLLTGAMRDGRDGEAQRLVNRALELEPKSPWALKMELALEVKKGQWNKAAESLVTIRKLGAMDMAELARLEGAVWYLQAVEADLAKDPVHAVNHLEKAMDKRPGFPPAMGLMARLLVADGKASKAKKRLMKAWSTTPHPDLAKALLDLSPMDRATEKLAHIKELIKANPTHRESRVALALAELAAGHGAEASVIATRLVEEEASARVYKILADAELMLGHAAKAEDLRAKAKFAPAGKGWHCVSCGAEAKAWTPLCGKCHEFDSVEWGAPAIKVSAKKISREASLSLLPDSLQGQPPRPDA